MSANRTFDSIVIGGGLNGLAAAGVLARAGQSVCLLERAPHLGGMAAPGASGAPRLAHLLYNLSPVVRRDLGLGARDWPFESVTLPTVALSEDGRHVVTQGASVRFADGGTHPDAAAFAALTERLTTYAALLRHLAEAAPPGGAAPILSSARLKEVLRLGRVGLGLRRLGKPEMRRFLQILLSNAYDLILDELPDGPLAGLLAADAVRGAAAGPRAPGTVFGLLYRMGHGGGASLPMGGMTAVIDAFAGAVGRAGAVIETGTGVARILTDQDRVTGVITDRGETLNAARVLSSSGARITAEMTGLAHFDIETSRRLRHIRARGTVAKINLTLSSLPAIPGLPDDLLAARLVIAPSATYVEEAFNPSKYREISPHPVIEALLPGQTDPAQRGAQGHALSLIVQYAPVDLAGGWDEAARAALLQTTLKTLTRYAPGLPDLVIGAEVIPPDQIEAETGAPGGHWHHAEMSLDQLLAQRPAIGIGRYQMGPSGLYLCGASAHPGGDLMGLAGRNAARAALGGTP
jgi:phytoene dehydrogenase-like protein